MLYVCDNCGFVFSRADEQDQCPDCGKHMVRSANAVEQGEFTSRMMDLIRGGCAGNPRFPNMVETEIFMLSSFAFKLPATALQIDSGMMVEVMVEYGRNSVDRDELIANVWAKQVDGVTIRFLMPIRLPAKEDEPQREQVKRIFAALNENESFKTRLYDFVAGQLMDGG